MENWDCDKKKFVKTSEDLKKFFNEIETVCKKNGYSISHEDSKGSFQIEKYSNDNIEWLKIAKIKLNI